MGQAVRGQTGEIPRLRGPAADDRRQVHYIASWPGAAVGQVVRDTLVGHAVIESNNGHHVIESTSRCRQGFYPHRTAGGDYDHRLAHRHRAALTAIGKRDSNAHLVCQLDPTVGSG